ncbi:MAG: type II toxin-antitoxin system RelE/ParE family toxin [Actinomycetia bacterium]|nr:type II toxin-antitoxin system RelE/ParE family toxin [Actinomycetes bacterium]
MVERTKYYRSEGGDELGGRFFDTAIEGLGAIQRMPGSGSPRIGELCDVPGLRSRRVTGFACGWFYFERVGYIDVVRLLAYAQNLATILGDLDENW